MLFTIRPAIGFVLLPTLASVMNVGFPDFSSTGSLRSMEVRLWRIPVTVTSYGSLRP
jgi:hypothetical protein